MTKIVGEDLAGLVPAVLPKLHLDPNFERGTTIYERIEGEFRRNRDYAASIDIEHVRREYALFARAYVMNANGHSCKEISRTLSDPRAEQWLKQDRIPQGLLSADPQRGRESLVRVNAPTGESPDFAYLLGAYAGNRRVGEGSIQVSFQSTDGQTIERLVEAVQRACGIDLGVRRATAGEYTYVSACSRVRGFARLLHDASNGNTAVPWEHVQTSAERREFLRGFFDFCGGHVDHDVHRLSVSRVDNLCLLREVALVLKREEVYPRVSEKGPATIFIDAQVELARLRNIGVVVSPDLRGKLDALVRRETSAHSASVNDYTEVMRAGDEVIQRGERSGASEVRRILREEGAPQAEIPSQTVRRWVFEGRVPPSAQRLEALESLEADVFTPKRLAKVGAKIVARLGENLHPRAVIGAIADFYGGEAPLARSSGLRAPDIREFCEGRRIPSRAEYRFLLAAVELQLKGALESRGVMPEFKTVKEWFPAARTSEVVMSYPSSVMRAVREAFERGDDPKQAALEMVARLMKRNDRMIVEERPHSWWPRRSSP